jgi:predicted nucleotidyltransferase
MNERALSGLAGALFSTVQQRVLAIVFGQPDRDFSTSEVIRLAGSGTGAVHRELGRLSASGLVTVTRIGNQKRYRANRGSPIFEELRGLIVKTVGLVGPLADALSPLASKIRTAFVFGSVAKSEDTSESDLDLMIIGDDLAYAEVYTALQDVEARLGRSIHPNVMSAGDWHRKLVKRSAFVTRVNSQPKLFVLGSKDDLLRIGQSRQNRNPEGRTG